jgi:hypothetical protein
MNPEKKKINNDIYFAQEFPVPLAQNNICQYRPKLDKPSGQNYC